MTFDFDAGVDRRGTDALKWEIPACKWNAPEAIPMWVADMDFVSPPAVVEALARRVEHGVFGYASTPPSVFEAIAHRNPYPRAHFDDHRWNHMVLKALFIGAPLAPIQGLDERANAELARILCDFAHERWAAGRPVPAELWRCVGPFAEGPAIDDLSRVLKSDSIEEQRAAAAALAASRDPRAKQLLATTSR